MTAEIRKVTVFIPTLDAGPGFAEVLTALRRQKAAPFTTEIRVIDSGSTDGTCDTLRAFGVPYTSIAKSEFDHGLTRDRAVRESDADLVAFLSQDALPVGDTYLSDLARPFADPNVAGTWARQLPRPLTHPFQKVHLAAHGAGSGSDVVLEPFTPDAFAHWKPEERLARIGFDDVAAMVRRASVLKTPFRKSNFGEDLTFARDVLLGGARLVYVPRATVLHSHPFSKRELIDRTYLTYALRRRLADFSPFPTRALFFRRTLGQCVRFARAALGDREHGVVLRLLWAFAYAAPCAFLMMRAMRSRRPLRRVRSAFSVTRP